MWSPEAKSLDLTGNCPGQFGPDNSALSLRPGPSGPGLLAPARPLRGAPGPKRAAAEVASRKARSTRLNCLRAFGPGLVRLVARRGHRFMSPTAKQRTEYGRQFLDPWIRQHAPSVRQFVAAQAARPAGQAVRRGPGSTP